MASSSRAPREALPSPEVAPPCDPADPSSGFPWEFDDATLPLHEMLNNKMHMAARNVEPWLLNFTCLVIPDICPNFSLGYMIVLRRRVGRDLHVGKKENVVIAPVDREMQSPHALARRQRSRSVVPVPCTAQRSNNVGPLRPSLRGEI